MGSKWDTEPVGLVGTGGGFLLFQLIQLPPLCGQVAATAIMVCISHVDTVAIDNLTTSFGAHGLR